MSKETLYNVIHGCITLILSGVLAIVGINQCTLEERIQYTHITPELNIGVREKNGFFTLGIQNNSPIKVVSIYVKSQSFLYLENTKKIKVYGRHSGPGMSDPWQFIKALEPEEQKFETFSAIGAIKGEKGKNKISIIKFDISFYRETDMKEFKEEKLYFFWKGKLYSHSEFLNNVHYKSIRRELARVLNAENVQRNKKAESMMSPWK